MEESVKQEISALGEYDVGNTVWARDLVGFDSLELLFDLFLGDTVCCAAWVHVGCVTL